jgi:hypothetical protein
MVVRQIIISNRQCYKLNVQRKIIKRGLDDTHVLQKAAHEKAMERCAARLSAEQTLGDDLLWRSLSITVKRSPHNLLGS